MSDVTRGGWTRAVASTACLLPILLLLAACSGSSPPDSREWRGERSVSGGVTTVRTLSGSVWVLRPGPGVHIEGCDERLEDPTSFWRDPCWRDSNSLEVFELKGRYLGEVTLPEGIRFRPRPKFEGDHLVAHFEDEAGIPYVKLYRVEIGQGGGSD